MLMRLFLYTIALLRTSAQTVPQTKIYGGYVRTIRSTHAYNILRLSITSSWSAGGRVCFGVIFPLACHNRPEKQSHPHEWLQQVLGA